MFPKETYKSHFRAKALWKFFSKTCSAKLFELVLDVVLVPLDADAGSLVGFQGLVEGLFQTVPGK